MRKHVRLSNAWAADYTTPAMKATYLRHTRRATWAVSLCAVCTSLYSGFVVPAIAHCDHHKRARAIEYAAYEATLHLHTRIEVEQRLAGWRRVAHPDGKIVYKPIRKSCFRFPLCAVRLPLYVVVEYDKQNRVTRITSAD